jgi:hypothetical protein
MPTGQHHEFLHVDVVVGMCAAVDDVHHRHRQAPEPITGKMRPQRQLLRGGDRVRVGERDAEQRVRAQAALVVGAVEVDQAAVEPLLVVGVETLERIGDRRVDVRNRLLHSLAEVARLVAVAQLDRFLGTGGGARGHHRAAEAAVAERDLGFEGGIAAAVEDFAGVDLGIVVIGRCLDSGIGSRSQVVLQPGIQKEKSRRRVDQQRNP